jgi:hypothetical protein
MDRAYNIECVVALFVDKHSAEARMATPSPAKISFTFGRRVAIWSSDWSLICKPHTRTDR